MFQILLIRRQTGQKPERVVLQHVDTLMVGSQIVDLLLVNRHPEIGADELHCVELVLEARPFPGEAFDQAIAGRVADVLQCG